MQTDILGVKREQISTRELASSKFAVITLGGTNLTGGNSSQPSLVQNATWTYSRDVQTVYEVGSGSVFMNGGRTTGNVGLARVIGNAGFYSALESGRQECGEIRGLSITLKGDTCAAASINNNRLAFDHGMVTSLTGSLNAQTTVIDEGVQMLVATMSRG